MNVKWADLLADNDIRLVIDCQDSGADKLPESGTGPQLVDLSSISVVDVTGEDATRFLQSQFCNDLTKVSATQAQVTGYCTPKGRLLALPVVVGFAEGYRLLLPEDVLEAFVKRLSMFVLREKVKITRRSDWVCTGLVSDAEGSLGLAQERVGILPGAAMGAVTTEDSQLIRWHDDRVAEPRARYLRLASIPDQLLLWRACGSDATLPIRLSGHSSWRLGDISAGIPAVSAAVSDAFVPQMVNLQLIGGLSFTKGCYPGQEIVARMQYLGKLKRQLRRFTVSPDATGAVPTPAPGESLSSGEDADAGTVVDAVPGPDGQVHMLAVVKVSAAGPLLTSGGSPLIAADLPYDLSPVTASGPGSSATSGAASGATSGVESPSDPGLDNRAGYR